MLSLSNYSVPGVVLIILYILVCLFLKVTKCIVTFAHFHCFAHFLNEETEFQNATAWMELDSILLSEISQAVKDKYDLM